MMASCDNEAGLCSATYIFHPVQDEDDFLDDRVGGLPRFRALPLQNFGSARTWWEWTALPKHSAATVPNFITWAARLNALRVCPCSTSMSKMERSRFTHISLIKCRKTGDWHCSGFSKARSCRACMPGGTQHLGKLENSIDTRWERSLHGPSNAASRKGHDSVHRFLTVHQMRPRTGSIEVKMLRMACARSVAPNSRAAHHSDSAWSACRILAPSSKALQTGELLGDTKAGTIIVRASSITA